MKRKMEQKKLRWKNRRLNWNRKTPIWMLMFLLSFFLTACSTEIPQEMLDYIVESGKIVESSQNDTSHSEERESYTSMEEGKEASGSDSDYDSVDGDNIPAEDGMYTSKEDVAYYLHLYGHLPSNFITKKEAEKLGWQGGSLEPFAPGMCIGGNRFGNYEGLLPEKEGRFYTECDIDTMGEEKRGAKRIVFSNDGLIYYTEDHYNTFELLYGEE